MSLPSRQKQIFRGWRSQQHQARPSLRPQLEVLEDRCLPSVEYFGGPIIPNVQVNTLFLGPAWSTDNNVGAIGIGLDTYLQTLVNSPYMDLLGQYNVGRGSFGSYATYTMGPFFGTLPVNDATPTANGLTELQQDIVAAIQAGGVPPPNANQLYFVFLPPDVQVERPGGLNNDPNNGFYGYHDTFNSSYGRINYAVLPFPGGSNLTVPGVPTVFDSLTEAVSHELSEAVTDPVPPTGWVDPHFASTPQEGEIGDIVNLQYVYWNGYIVQKEANQQDQPIPLQLPASGSLMDAATAGQGFNRTVMSFTDHSSTVFGDTPTQPRGGSPLPGSDFQVTINWGDGQTSSAQVVYDGNGQYSVVGAHSYAQSGTYQIGVSATDPYGVTARASSTMTVAPAPLSALVAEFPGGGVWRYTASSGWQQLTSANATSVASGQNGAVAAFGGAGVYLWTNNSGWRQLSPYNASQVAINSSNEVTAEFPGGGVWLWNPSQGWKQLTPYDASALAIDDYGDVTAEFPGSGLWLYTSFGSSGAWKQITPFDASLFAETNGYVVAEFPGSGVWLYTPSQNWRQLTAADASSLAVDGNGNVFAAFGGAGTYLYQNSSSTWQNMGAPSAARQVGMDAADVLFVELANGLWKIQNGVWYQIDPYNPSQFSISSSAL